MKKMYFYTVNFSEFSTVYEDDLKVKIVIEEILNKSFYMSFNEEILKESVETRLNSARPRSNFSCSVDSMYRLDKPEKKSYFINIQQNNRHMMFFADLKELDSLKKIASWEMSKILKTRERAAQLREELPETLVNEIRKHF